MWLTDCTGSAPSISNALSHGVLSVPFPSAVTSTVTEVPENVPYAVPASSLSVGLVGHFSPLAACFPAILTVSVLLVTFRSAQACHVRMECVPSGSPVISSFNVGLPVPSLIFAPSIVRVGVFSTSCNCRSLLLTRSTDPPVPDSLQVMPFTV